MIFLITLICSLISCKISEKYYLLIFICIIIYMINLILRTYFLIDFGPFFTQIRYLLYIMFFYKFALEECGKNGN